MSENEQFSQRDIDEAVEYAKLKKDVETLNAVVETQGKVIQSLQKDRDSALRWGILALGTAVVSMGTWIFNLLTARLPS